MQTMQTGAVAAPAFPGAAVYGQQYGQIVQGPDGQQYVMMPQPGVPTYASTTTQFGSTPVAYSTSPQMYGVMPGQPPSSAQM